jgi:hypothetical protein
MENNTNLDIKERVKIYQFILNKLSIDFNNVKLVGYEVKFPQKTKMKNRTHYLIKPPFSYYRRKKYNFKYNDKYLDLFKKHNYYSLIAIKNLKSKGEDFVNKIFHEVIKEICCTFYFTYTYLWTRSIIESLIERGYKIKVIESKLEINSVIFYPLLSDLESEDPDIIINLSWYPKKCELNKNVLNLSIFNNI